MITFVHYSHDWCAIYVDGKKEYVGHPPDAIDLCCLAKIDYEVVEFDLEHLKLFQKSGRCTGDCFPQTLAAVRNKLKKAEVDEVKTTIKCLKEQLQEAEQQLEALS